MGCADTLSQAGCFSLKNFPSTFRKIISGIVFTAKGKIISSKSCRIIPKVKKVNTVAWTSHATTAMNIANGDSVEGILEAHLLRC